MRKRVKLALERRQKRFDSFKEGETVSYNPPPKRKEEMTKNELKVARHLKRKEKERNTPQRKGFSGWEYSDRYSHRKTS